MFGLFVNCNAKPHSASDEIKRLVRDNETLRSIKTDYEIERHRQDREIDRLTKENEQSKVRVYTAEGAIGVLKSQVDELKKQLADAHKESETLCQRLALCEVAATGGEVIVAKDQPAWSRAYAAILRMRHSFLRLRVEQRKIKVLRGK